MKAADEEGYDSKGGDSEQHPSDGSVDIPRLSGKGIGEQRHRYLHHEQWEPHHTLE